MKKASILLLLITALSISFTALAGPPSIEISIYPRYSPGEVQQALDFIKSKQGKVKIKKLIYENDVLTEISGSIVFEDGIKSEFSASNGFKRLYIKRTYGNDNKIYVKEMRKSEEE